jgi:hypothetical protein
MATYRIKIEETSGSQNKHIEQFVVDTESIDSILDIFKHVSQKERELAEQRFIAKLSQSTSLAVQFITDMDDQFDSESVGDDITPEEFLENEMYFARME